MSLSEWSVSIYERSGASLLLTLLRARHVLEDDEARAKMTFRMAFYVIVFIGFWVRICLST